MEDKAKLYVGNLPYNMNDEALTATFAKVGEVKDVKVITDKYSGRSRGFGFVTMADEDTAKKAVETMNGKEVEGRELVVNIAQPMKPREDR